MAETPPGKKLERYHAKAKICTKVKSTMRR